jgi:AcrR family transcriptional regulator
MRESPEGRLVAYQDRTPSQDPAPGGRRDRADVRRNRELLLAAARAVYAEEGADAPLKAVAARAGLGVGTVYRHFATQDALVEAVLVDHLAALDGLATHLRCTHEPHDALAAWLQEFVRRLTEYRGLAGVVLPQMKDPHSPVGQACQRLREVAGEMLVDAQRDGSVRSDVDVLLMLTLANAVALVVEQRPHQAGSALSFMVSGLRPE